jgi:hypothetical protein
MPTQSRTAALKSGILSRSGSSVVELRYFELFWRFSSLYGTEKNLINLGYGCRDRFILEMYTSQYCIALPFIAAPF